MKRSRWISVWSLGLAMTGCGLDVASSEQTIVNGRPATQAELFGTVGIPIGNPADGSNCTGTLIRPNVVLSAAHCFYQSGPDDMPTNDPVPLTDVQVVAGALSLDAATQDQRYAVTQMFLHPGYDNVGFNADPSVGPAVNDIAVLVLDRNVTQVSVVPLLSANEQAMFGEGAAVVITGYGATSLEGGMPAGGGTLYIAENVITALSDTEFIASSETGADTCPGDSGGPAYLFVGDAPRVVGATSRADPEAQSLCGEGGVYTTAHAFEAWINAQVGPPGGGGGCSVAGSRSTGAALVLALAGMLFAVRRRRR
jgi:endonuclease G